jgi:hypothetical protein
MIQNGAVSVAGKAAVKARSSVTTSFAICVLFVVSCPPGAGLSTYE